ncbi:MAG: alanine--tRNA ligase [Acidobacteria bacterium]|nr:alanine--tRNA ligase [Acidobacteriota bacterium]
MHSREIRRGFLDFFEQHGHRIVASSPLVPADDPTLLFTNAGMNQFKDLFLGKERRSYARAATSQKCMRVSGKHNDLDNVGPSLRHHTFFEMLGNFSFGDYFKTEAIEFAWRALTEVWALPADRLHATVFCGEHGVPRDAEAFDLWTRYLPTARIVELGSADNFWQMGETGPCGRCSEIHFHRPELPCPRPVCQGPACDCDRFVEIWNNVFMEFDRQSDGTLNPLPAPSIDTGMGLERLTAVIQGTLSNYDTDLFQPVLGEIGRLTGHRYGDDPRSDVSMRVVADHVRAMTFLVADGVVPSNEWRGYVLRKIMRRAMRHGKKLGATEPFLFRLVAVLAREMGDAYPELVSGQETIERTVRAEEDRFDAVLTSGLPRLEEALERAAAGTRVVAGDDVFRLYDSLGVPVDFVEDLASERGLAVDRAGFDRAMEGQREKARAASAFESKRGEQFTFASEQEGTRLLALDDRFDGYATTVVTGQPVVALFDDTQGQVDTLPEGATGFVLLPRTPFYVESGGQVSDTGTLHSDATGAVAHVVGMTRLSAGGPRVHRVVVASGSLRAGEIVAAEVDRNRRDATRRNHTATHLLHAALRRVLGPHVKQAGSLVAPDRLRFDFVHFSPISKEELAEIERIVNAEIYRNTPVETEVKATDEAIAAGAMALFGEKYGETVRVVSVASFSLELCGGTHCRATGDIGPFVVVAEGGIAAGTRRIEAVTGDGAVALIQARGATLARLLEAIGQPEDQAVDAIDRLHAEVKRLGRDVADLKVKLAMGGGAAAQDDALDVEGVRLVARRVDGLDKHALRTLADSLRSKLGSGVVVLASAGDGKVTLVVGVTKDLVDRVPAGRVVRDLAPIVGGRGGGRADFAEAGGRDAMRIGDVLAASREVVADLLKGAMRDGRA